MGVAMGLVVTSYRELIADKNNDGINLDGQINKSKGWFQVIIQPHQQQLAPDLVNGGIYISPTEYSFSTGGVDVYKDWLKQLGDIFRCRGTELTFSDGVVPFLELFDFTEAQGYLGHQLSKKLANDFRLFEHFAKNENPTFNRIYGCFRHAFLFSSWSNGAVRFEQFT